MSCGLNSQKISIKNKKILEKEIPKLSQNEYSEIFNIIRNNSNSKYSENARGVYINLKYLDENTINKMIEFIDYTKKNKSQNNKEIKQDNKLVNKDINSKLSHTNKYTLDQESIHKELLRLKEKNSDNFSFQNFLDKLSVTNIKQFAQNDGKICYPTLKNSKAKFGGVKARLLKKCKEVNRNYQETSYIANLDTISNDSSDDEGEKEENKITKIIKNLSSKNLDIDVSDDENDF